MSATTNENESVKLLVILLEEKMKKKVRHP